MSGLILQGINFSQYLEDQGITESEMLRNVSDFSERLRHLLKHGNQLVGAYFPWGKVQHTTRVGDGKLSIWAGESGSGKSLMLGQVILNCIAQGRKACIASLEMHPEQTLFRMVNQSATCKASVAYGDKWQKHHEGKLYIYDRLERINTNSVLGMAHYAANVLGCNDIVIDSLTKCSVGRDADKQAEFVDQLQWCVKRWNVHVHLVAHMRKPDKGERSGKYSVRGAAEITDLADNVYIVTRNRKKEAEIHNKMAGLDYNADILAMPDAWFEVAKNRDYGEEKSFGLWLDHVSGVYKESEHAPLHPLTL